MVVVVVVVVVVVAVVTLLMGVLLLLLLLLIPLLIMAIVMDLSNWCSLTPSHKLGLPAVATFGIRSAPVHRLSEEAWSLIGDRGKGIGNLSRPIDLEVGDTFQARPRGTAHSAHTACARAPQVVSDGGCSAPVAAAQGHCQALGTDLQVISAAI